MSFANLLKVTENELPNGQVFPTGGSLWRCCFLAVMADHGGEVGGSERIFQEGPQKEGRNFIEEVTEPEKKFFF